MMERQAEFRLTYLGAAPHTLFSSLIWFSGAFLSDQVSRTTGVIVFIVGASLTFPGGELIRKLMRATNFISAGNTLGKFFALSAFAIPLSYPLIYLACKSNVNYFFPVFNIVVGAHYLVFIYGYGMITFGGLSLLMVTQGMICAIFYPNHFALSGYITSITLLVFSILHYSLVKKQLL